ncbi:hypothetical protein GCM10019059_44380 [Camelimonas fluminis]|nr:hypothetical protein GCM10019059_44380 [Camelimonas fluminis]
MPPAPPREPPVKPTKISRTDRDSGYMVRDGKPKGFFYLDHRTVDGKFSIITDSFATPANVHDSIPYLERLDRQRARFGLPVTTVGLDAGYATAAIAHGLEQRSITGVTGYRTPSPPRPGMMRPSRFIYEEQADIYRCPQGQAVAYATTDRQGYRHYHSDPDQCRACPLLASCTTNAQARRIITRHVWQDARARTDAPASPSGAGWFTQGARRQWSAPLQTPGSSSATATPASGASRASGYSACSPLPRRTSRKSPRSAQPPRASRPEGAALSRISSTKRRNDWLSEQPKQNPCKIDGVR